MKVTTAWRSGVASDPGMVRSNNEDRVYADDAASIFLVVDGMGGRAAGDRRERKLTIATLRLLTNWLGVPDRCERGDKRL